jgi:hypothetical protein
MEALLRYDGPKIEGLSFKVPRSSTKSNTDFSALLKELWFSDRSPR